MTNKSNSHLARYAVTSPFLTSIQFAWFVSYGDAKDFITALNAEPNYYSIEEVD